MDMTKAQIPWLEKGYQTFALKGPKELKIERLAKDIGKNKSSFYHLFADLNLFVGTLLDYHLIKVNEIALKEARATSMEELIDVLVEHKMDLLLIDNCAFTERIQHLKNVS